MEVINGTALKAFLFIIILCASIVGGIFVLAFEILPSGTIKSKTPLRCDTTVTIKNGKVDTLYIYHLPK